MNCPPGIPPEQEVPMAKQAKGNGKTKKARPGEQLVLRVPPETKALIKRAARDAFTSMNRAATTRLATGRWPRHTKEAK
jgi:hypothetical protein